MSKREKRKRNAKKEKQRLSKKNEIVYLGLLGKCPMKKGDLSKKTVEFYEERDTAIFEALARACGLEYIMK